MRKVAPGVFLVLAFGAGYLAAIHDATERSDAELSRVIRSREPRREIYTSDEAWERAKAQASAER